MLVKMKDICTKVGSGATPKGGNNAYIKTGITLIRSQNIHDFYFSHDGLAHINDEQAAKLNGVRLEEDDVLLNITGDSVARACKVDNSVLPARVNQHVCIVRGDKRKVLSSYVLYYLQMKKPELLMMASSGATRNALTKGMIEELELDLPSLQEQKKIVSLLDDIQCKILNNNRINRNLSEQAFALFKEMFPNVNQGEHTLGEYLSAVKGKALLSKDAVEGDVPVIAGGLSPATYHNVANTKAPVLTISASGANAGYVALWNVDVWSSDSSYIDSNMTENVYFWYVMLKTRQKEIFDAHTGSVQPHIYPKNIDDLSVAELDRKIVTDYTMQVSPLFELIGKNIKENERLIILRDSLLPKLMSGDLNVSNLYI